MSEPTRRVRRRPAIADPFAVEGAATFKRRVRAVAASALPSSKKVDASPKPESESVSRSTRGKDTAQASANETAISKSKTRSSRGKTSAVKADVPTVSKTRSGATRRSRKRVPKQLDSGKIPLELTAGSTDSQSNANAGSNSHSNANATAQQGGNANGNAHANGHGGGNGHGGNSNANGNNRSNRRNKPSASKNGNAANHDSGHSEHHDTHNNGSSHDSHADKSSSNRNRNKSGHANGYENGGDDNSDSTAQTRGAKKRRGRVRRGRKTRLNQDRAKQQTGQNGSSDAMHSSDGSSEVLLPRNKNLGRASRRERIMASPIGSFATTAAATPKTMLVRTTTEMTQIVVLEDRTLVEHYVADDKEKSLVGNIYKGRVQNVLPGMETAFVDIGQGRNGVLYASDIIYDQEDIETAAPPRIEQILQPGQVILVQVTKDAMGTKGVRLTQQLSLAGRYCVLSPLDKMFGISRKLPDQERDRLRRAIKPIRLDEYGLIVRTAAEGATQEQLIADFERLVKRWEVIKEKSERLKPLESVYLEPDLVLRVIRDAFGPEYKELICDDKELADRVKEYLEETIPEYADKVSVYQGVGENGESKDLFADYQIHVQIRRALETKVWLRSGGYLIIEKTEAMWVIDVNTGRFVGKDDLEETILLNNLEAAEEIARQLRLRDMGGIIVIDFVDMQVAANRNEVMRRFKFELSRDKTRTRSSEISKLGLVQMTRKNVAKGLIEMYTELTDDVIPGRRIRENLLD